MLSLVALARNLLPQYNIYKLQPIPIENKFGFVNNAILRFVIILHETFLFQLKSLPEADASIKTT